MKIVVYYNKNLKMSTGKIAAQVGHVCKELGKKDYLSFFQKSDDSDTIVVLGLRKNKFIEKLKQSHSEYKDKFFYMQIDKGLTEVEIGTLTAFGYIE